MNPEEKELTARQKRFVDEYLIDLNATAAYKRAGYTAEGNAAEAAASRMLSNVKVAEAIQKAMDGRSNETKIDAARVLSEIGKLAFADIRKVFDEHGRLRPIHELPDEIAASVSSIEVVTSRIPGGEPSEVEHTAKIKFWDKRGSLELLGRHLKMFTDKTEVSGKDGGPIEHKVDPITHLLSQCEGTFLRPNGDG